MWFSCLCFRFPDLSGVGAVFYGWQTQSNCRRLKLWHLSGSNHCSLYPFELACSFRTNIRMPMNIVSSGAIAIEFGYCDAIQAGKEVNLNSSPDFVILHNP